ncbi:MAG: type II toxin-antitoxin system VapC family toxin [Solirubrobacterales bacterium]
MGEGSGARGLLDTSVVISSDQIDRALLPDEIAISSLTLAELTAGPFAAEDDLARVRRQERLQRFETGVVSLPFESRCARAYGQVYVATVTAGRKPRGSRIVDLMIAATALAHAMPLYTQNSKDLRGLDDLIEIVDVSL